MKGVLLNSTDPRIIGALESYYKWTKHGVRGHIRWLCEKVIFDPTSIIIGFEDLAQVLRALFVVRLENQDEAILLFSWSSWPEQASGIKAEFLSMLKRMGVNRLYASLFSTHRRALAAARLIGGKVTGHIVEVDLR